MHPLNTTDSSTILANKSKWHHKTQNQYGDKNKFKNQSENVTRQNKKCTHCEGTGHTMDRCFWIIGFSLGHKLHKVYTGKSAAAVTQKNTQQHIDTSSTRNHSSVDELIKTEVPNFTQEQYNQNLNLLKTSTSPRNVAHAVYMYSCAFSMFDRQT